VNGPGSSAGEPPTAFATVPGAHSFPWTAPDAWSQPIERLAREVA
jgi:hypothetical protein